MAHSNIDQLHDAKVINKDDLDKSEIKAVESLSQEEVENLIKVRKSLEDKNENLGYIV